MTQYSTDFGDQTIGQAPTGWTAMTIRSTPLIQSSLWGVSGKHMKLTNTNASRSALMWDAVAADPDRADFEIYMRCRPIELGVAAKDARYGLAGRIVGNTANALDFGDWVAIETGGEANNVGYAEAFNGSGTGFVLYSPPANFPLGFYPATATVNHIKLRVSGSNLKMKCWLDPDPEPGWQGDWTMDVGSPTAPGNIGIYDRYSEFEVDYFSVGTGTDVAPMPAAAGPAITNVSDGVDSRFYEGQTGVIVTGSGFDG